MNIAYYVKFQRITDTYYRNYMLPNLRRIFENENEKDLVAIENSIEPNEDGLEVAVFFLSSKTLHILLDFCLSEKLITLHYDLSNNLKFNNIRDPTVLKMMRSEEYKYLFESFLLKNLTINNILDKINEKGMKSLTKMDYRILKKVTCF